MVTELDSDCIKLPSGLTKKFDTLTHRCDKLGNKMSQLTLHALLEEINAVLWFIASIILIQIGLKIIGYILLFKATFDLGYAIYYSLCAIEEKRNKGL